MRPVVIVVFLPLPQFLVVRRCSALVISLESKTFTLRVFVGFSRYLGVNGSKFGPKSRSAQSCFDWRHDAEGQLIVRASDSALSPVAEFAAPVSRRVRSKVIPHACGDPSDPQSQWAELRQRILTLAPAPSRRGSCGAGEITEEVATTLRSVWTAPPLPS